MKVTSGRSSSSENKNSITSLNKSCLDFFKSNKTQKELIITQPYLISLINYITLEVLNASDIVTIEQLQLLHVLLNNAKERSMNVNNLLLEYLISVCCALIIKENKTYKKEQSIKAFIDNLIKIIDVSYIHLTAINPLFYKKIILIISLLEHMKINYSFSFTNEHSFILEYIDMMDLSEEHIDEIKDSFITELFIDREKQSVLNYLCLCNDEQIRRLIENNSHLFKEVDNALNKFKKNLNEIYHSTYIKNFTRKIIERASSNSNIHMKKIEMNCLFKKLNSLNDKYSNVAADILANVVTTKKLTFSYEWRYIFNLLEIIDKNVLDERSKLDATIVEVIDLYNKQQFYGTFNDFDTLCLQKYFTFQNIELPYQQLKIDFMFQSLYKFNKHFPIISEHYLKNFMKSDLDNNKETIHYLFDWLDFYYKLYSFRNDDINLINKLVVNNFFPFYNLFINSVVRDSDSTTDVKEYTARWEKTFTKVMTLTTSNEVIEKGFEIVHNYDAFLRYYPLTAFKKIMKNAFLFFETFKLEIFCNNILKGLLCADNTFSELNTEIHVIQFLFNFLQMLYVWDDGFVYYKRMPVIGTSPMIHADTMNIIEDNKDCVSFSVKEILNYFKKFLCTNFSYSTCKEKKKERKHIWQILNDKAQTNIHFFKGQDISIIHDFIREYVVNNKTSKQNVKEICLIFMFLNSICEYISENDTRIFKGIVLNQNDNFYIMRTYLHEYAEVIVDDLWSKNNLNSAIESMFDYGKNISPHIAIFIHITKTLENYICTAYKKQNIHFGIINRILHEFILKVLFKIRCYLAYQSKNDLNKITFCILKFLSATKDIILQNPEITVLTVLLLSTLSFESRSNGFLKEFKKKFVTALKDLNIKDFNLFKSVNVNIQLQISIDYLTYYLLSKTKDISFTKDVVNIYHHLFKKESKKIHKKVFSKFIKWSLIEKDVDRNNNTNEYRKYINEHLTIEYSVKLKSKHITVLTSKQASNKYSILTRSPFLNFHFSFLEPFSNQNDFHKKLEHYFGYDASNKKYQESTEEKIRIIQQAYRLQNFRKELSKDKHNVSKTKEQEHHHIDKLDNIDIYRTFKVNVIWYNSAINMNDDNVEYSSQFKEFLNGLNGENTSIDRDDKLQIKVIHYKEIVNKIDFHIKRFVPPVEELKDSFILVNCNKEQFQTKYLDFVSIVYVEDAAKFKIENIIKLINDDKEHSNKFYIIIYKCTPDTYQMKIHCNDDNMTYAIMDFFVHVMFYSVNDCVSFIKQNLFETIIMLNLQEQYHSSKEYTSKNVDKELFNSYYSEFDNMYKRYKYISEHM